LAASAPHKLTKTRQPSGLALAADEKRAELVRALVELEGFVAVSFLWRAGFCPLLQTLYSSLARFGLSEGFSIYKTYAHNDIALKPKPCISVLTDVDSYDKVLRILAEEARGVTSNGVNRGNLIASGGLLG
jgi:hypothetical protein